MRRSDSGWPGAMQPLPCLLLCALMVLAGSSYAGQNEPAFQTYPATPDPSAYRAPTWAHKEEEEAGPWRDEFGKLVETPQVNFAGHYYLAVHSCGASCRYYSLTDLRTGRELPVPDQFQSTESKRTRINGRPYVAELIYRPDSRLLIVQLSLEYGRANEADCTEQAYEYLAEEFMPIKAKRTACEKF